MRKVAFVEDPEEFERMCSGCRLCELVCAFFHHRVGNARRARIRVVSLEPGGRVPVTCRQCEQPLCEAACPVGAIRKKRILLEGVPEVIVDVDPGRCIGCGVCTEVCPVGAIEVDPVARTASKCDLCDGDPQCVRYCPAGTLRLATDEQIGFLKKQEFACWRAKVPQEDVQGRPAHS